MSKTSTEYFKGISRFKNLEYKTEPYSARNWGNNLHSLCSYQGKLKPAIAHFLIKEITSPGDTILDPMSGSGTIPLEAFIQGRKAIGNDIQELGFILSQAKTSKPNQTQLEIELETFIDYVMTNSAKYSREARVEGEFGFNGKISEYFSKKNLNEVVAARSYIKSNYCNSVERAIVYASFLHILHGNRPYALSRKSHPVTPFKPSGEYEYKNFVERIKTKTFKTFLAHNEINQKTIPGAATLKSFERLNYRKTIDAIITSPPFAESTRFYSANWLRLWATGWSREDFMSRRKHFLEEKQKTNFEIYRLFFEKCDAWLKPRGKVVLHLGRTVRTNMAESISEFIPNQFKILDSFDEIVNNVETFGVTDQGVTGIHQFLFCEKNI